MSYLCGDTLGKCTTRAEGVSLLCVVLKNQSKNSTNRPKFDRLDSVIIQSCLTTRFQTVAAKKFTVLKDGVVVL